ncbi:MULTISPECIES: DUF2892 domain-containing protein [Bradyrhizobium]|jgi:hypothetical protein|uniref:DUF2892 domain-containing protein n=1 Tax=Bradyrhizobium TaxID=374 RepID=UPI00046253F2|nr:MULTISPECIES: DUF2892 domain-containing protein [Bradyrhizobium]ULK94919.1 DUF2892 domain-containing protein [Bradyrhizobium sp. I71]
MTTTRNRVPLRSSESDNRRIERTMRANVAFFAEHRDQIADRLRELDREWDIERTIEANAAVIGFTGIVLAAAHNQRWLALPALVTGFLFQHAIQGWCPPVPVLRKLGFRTSYEIEQERRALMALRGDFRHVAENADSALRAARGVPNATAPA